MSEAILEKNLSRIERYNKALAQKIREHDCIEGEIEFIASKTGDIILSYNGTPLHDLVDPVDESIKVFQKVKINTKTSIHVIYGLGLGYLFKRFTMNYYGRLIVYEPNLDILRITFETVDFSPELEKEYVAIVNKKEDIQKTFERFFFQDAEVSLSFLPVYSKICAEEINTLVEELGFINGLFSSNYKNLFEKSLLWTFTGVTNIPNVLRNFQLESLRNLFKGKPAVIISAGPSLTKNIDLLKEFRDKVVIFCVGTALKTALKHGIHPDFVVQVESLECLFQTSGVDTTKMNFIHHPATHWSTHELFTRHFNYYPNNDFISQWLGGLLDIPLKDYQNKGTVSLCAVYSSLILGCDKVILIGQDLAYTNGKCYTDGAAFGELKLVKDDQTGKMQVALDSDEAYLKIVDPESKYPVEEVIKAGRDRFNDINKGLIKVKSQNGEPLYTEPGYATFIRYFENLASEVDKSIKLINATEGGAYLEGFDHITLREALEKFTSESFDALEMITRRAWESSPPLEEKGLVVLQELDKSLKIFEQSFELFEQGAYHTEKMLKELRNRGYSDAIKKYSATIIGIYQEIENKILKQSQLVMAFILTPYLKLRNHLENPDINTGAVMIQKLAELSKEFFIDSKSYMNDAYICTKASRDKLYDICHPES